MNVITAYQCEHCRTKVYAHRSSARSHELRCFWNPRQMACASCEHRDEEIRFCTRLDLDLSSRKNLKHHCISWAKKQEEIEA